MIETKKIVEQYIKTLGTLTEINVDVWQTPFDEIHQKGIFRLIHYHPKVEKTCLIPVLVVYAFINRPYILDLQPERSIIGKFLDRGLDVYMIDWGYPKRGDKYLTLEDYIEYIDKAVGIMSQRTGNEKITLHGYCLGGTLSLIYSALYPEKVKNLVLQATPIDFDVQGTINFWVKSLDADKVVDAMGNVPGEFLNYGFLLANPIGLTFGKYANLLKEAIDEEFLKMFLRMEKWIFDSPDVPGETFRQYIKEWYQQNLLIKNEFILAGKKVDLRKITMPTVLLTADYDHIAPPESTKPLLDVISSTDKTMMSFPTGHIGVSVGSKPAYNFWPKVCDWITERSSNGMDSERPISNHQ
jgi:polyhydroxyalkanoate synthase